MRKFLTVLFLTALGLAIASPRAFAHAQLRSSDPRNGARLETAPNSVSLKYTEPPEESLSRVHVLDSSGESWERGDAIVAEEDEYMLRVEVEDLDEGVYTVTWRTVSKVDGHATSGVIAFGVGVDPTGAVVPAQAETDGDTDTSTDALEVGGRWVFLTGLVLLLGAITIGAAVVRAWSGGVRQLGELAALVAVVGLVIFAEGQRRVAEVSVGDFLATSIGEAVIWRTAALAVAVVGLAVARVGRTLKQTGPWVAVLGTVAAMLVHVNAGHAATDQSWSWAKVGAQWAHFAAAGVWIGGLAALLVATRGAASADKAVAVRRFSAMAAVLLVAVIISGVFRAVNEVEGWGLLFSTSYGQVVLVKAGLLLALVALGAINRYRSVPAASTSLSRLRKVSGIEIGVAGAALLAAALLATLNPAPSSEASVAPKPQGVAVSGSDFATSVRARLDVTPGGAGLNAFRLELADYDTGEPVRAERVSLGFTFAEDTGVARSELELKPAAPGEYRAEGSNLSLAGRWEVTVVVERGAESVEVPLEVATRCNAREEAEPGLQPVWVMELQHALTAEGYVDPGTEGHNDVHLTFFDGTHEETPIRARPTVAGTDADGEEAQLDLRRFGPGHFVASGHLVESEWRFEFKVNVHGQRMQGCFDEKIAAPD